MSYLARIILQINWKYNLPKKVATNWIINAQEEEFMAILITYIYRYNLNDNDNDKALFVKEKLQLFTINKNKIIQDIKKL